MARRTRLPLQVARIGARAARRAVREARDPHRWWAVRLRGALDGADLELRPAGVDDAEDWAQLVAEAGERPSGTGPGASPLGSATDAADWRRRCLHLRGAARHGRAFGYLARMDGRLVGEVLGFTDPGSSAVEIVCWLRPEARTPARTIGCVDLLARHVFAGPHPPDRALCYVAATCAGALQEATRLGFRREGTVTDPPRADLVLLVARRPGSGGTFDR